MWLLTWCVLLAAVGGARWGGVAGWVSAVSLADTRTVRASTAVWSAVLSPEALAGRRADLATIAGGNFVQFGIRALLGPLVPLLLVAFSTSKGEIGAILAGTWAVYALFQFPSGVLADRYGERMLLLAGLGGAVVGAFLIASAPSLLVFAVVALLLGSGAGLYFSPASALVSRLYDEHGAPLGILTASGAVALVVYPAAGGLLAVRYGWRVPVALAAFTGVVVFVAAVGLLPSLPAANPERRLSAALDPGRVRRLLGRRSVAFTVAVGVMVGFTFQALISFFPTFLVEHHGLDTGTAGLAFGGLFGLSSLAQPVAGTISDRYSRDTAIATSVTVTAVGLAVLLTASGLLVLVVGTALLGVGVSWPGVLQARFMDQFSDAERGYGFGLVRSVYMFLSASGSAVVGVLADVSGWPLAYGVVVVLLCCCLVMLAANAAFDLGL